MKSKHITQKVTMPPKFQVIIGDITRRPVEAIVNAANASLLGGGGVDGAIHRAAGPQLLEACRHLHGCRTGDAKATPGFRLTARWIFHAVGPVYRDGEHGEPELLAGCYRRCLQLAEEHGVRTLAFPAISTGLYRFPKPEAARIAVATCSEHAARHSLDRVEFVCFTPEMAALYESILSTNP